MRIDILTLFPQMFDSILGHSIIKRALDNNLLSIEITNIRDFAKNKHNSVDDYPYGGGPGMVMSIEPIYHALLNAKKINTGPVIMLSPQGKSFKQKDAEELSKLEGFTLLCGHYEGFDERIRENLIDMEISVGDYVLTGGEIPAMVIVDGVTRLLPGVLGDENSHLEESFTMGRLEYPQYTRPSEFLGWTVPEILLSGNHELIRKWRLTQSLNRTFITRPDLLIAGDLTQEEKDILKNLGWKEDNIEL